MNNNHFYVPEKVKEHLRNRPYMSGVERDANRIKATGEVFTPTPLVQEIISIVNKLSPDVFTDITNKVIDPTCGDGQFLSEIIIKKMENGSTYEEALSTTYGVDMEKDNCYECIRRLYGLNGDPDIETILYDDIPDDLNNWKRPGVIAIFKVNGRVCNIVCANGLEYNYRFGKEKLGDELFT